MLSFRCKPGHCLASSWPMPYPTNCGFPESLDLVLKRTIFTWVAILGVLGFTPAYGETPLAVEIVVAENKAEQQTLTLTGEIQAKETLMAAFPIGGRVTEVMVELGAKVEENQPLARLDSIQQELAVRTAEAGLTTARADHRQAVEDLERAEQLLSSGATTRAARDAAFDALRSAEGGLEQAEAELDRTTKALSDTVLRAPFASTVVSRDVEPGQIIAPAQTAMELALDKGFEAIFEVPEVMMIGEFPAANIVLSRLSDPKEQFEGRIGEVSPLIDEKTGTVATTVEVINPPTDLGYGEPVRGSATRMTLPQISLPYSVMSATADGPAVWQVDTETMQVSLHPVTIDRYETGRVLLSGGVEEGAWIVSKGAQLLYPGRTVRRAGENPGETQ
jgi:RND family efflux transporter MFP subunit